jgi:mannonate dehydratase
MDAKRRRWLLGGSAGLAALAAWRLMPDDGILNPCLGPLPPELASHPLVQEAWAGLAPADIWDVHAHFFSAPPDGGFDEARGTWRRPLAAAQYAFFANAACIDETAAGMDQAYLARLDALLAGMPAGFRLLLLALDAYHDESGNRHLERTHFWTGNEACARAAFSRPERLEWAASIHPYRPGAAAELARWHGLGARAVKWIPAAQGIDPASPRCDPFYAALAECRLPLITHAGAERATAGDDELGNPLRLRRALDHGVRVVVAHCATMGHARDLDRNAGVEENFRLFERLMDEPRHEGLLFGDLAAIPQSARAGPPLRRILARGAEGGDWSGRLLSGSDYPLPGILPLYSPHGLAADGLLDPAAVAPLTAIRRHNPLLFDFVLKRHLHFNGKRLAGRIFATRRFFGDGPNTQPLTFAAPRTD